MGINKLNRKAIKARSKSAKFKNRLALVESLERRELLAGPDLIAIRPDAGALLRDGDTLNIAPREFNLLFAGGAMLDESRITSNSVKLTRAGTDGLLGTTDDINVALGFVGLVNPGSTNPADLSQIVFRPASSAAFNAKDASSQFPDDLYQIQIVGTGVNALTGNGVAFNNGQNLSTTFRLDRGAQVVSVVPQPVTRTTTGALTQSAKSIDVYFDKQTLNDTDVKNVNFYRLVNTTTNTTLLPQNPITYDATLSKAVLTFASIPEGTYRLDIGQSLDNDTSAPTTFSSGAVDASVDFSTAFNLPSLAPGPGFSDKTIKISGSIDPQTSIALPPLPGGEDDPGHREIQREQHISATGTTPVTPTAVRKIEYYFPVELGRFNSGDPNNPGVYVNLITATEKQIVRDIFEIYARETGIEFIENTGQTGGLSIGKGDLRALDPMIGPTSGVAGLGGPGRVVLNQDSFTSSNRFYGDSFTGTMYHEIGHALSLGHAYDIPAVQGTGPIPNEVLPGDADLLHLKRLSPPNSTDIDLYKFTLPSGGQLKAEILAERLNTPSLLNSALRLYKLNSITNRYELLAQNDQYFGADAFINLHLDAGTYQIGVSSTGNTSYDPNVPNSGFGGTTDGLYELNLNFKADAASVLRDTLGTAFDGDADGSPGGVFHFWFQSSDVANTIFVDKLADTIANSPQGNGAINTPFDEIDSAIVAAGNRIIVPNGATAASLSGESFIIGNGSTKATFTFGGGANPINLLPSDTETVIAGRIKNAIDVAIGLNRLGIGVTTTTSGKLVQLSGSDQIDLSGSSTLSTTPKIIRIVGNSGPDGNLSTLSDNRPYLVGTPSGGGALADGAEFRVPAGVNVMIEAGTLIKMRGANIDAGSSNAGVSRAGGSIQVLGTPTNSVFLRSYHDDTVGGNSDGVGPAPSSGNFGGIVFRDDSDREANGIFLNYVNHADIKHGGGKVFVDGTELAFTSIHITKARPTLSYNFIQNSDTAAISASPNSFDDSLGRIGPDIHGNYLVSNSINGLAVRIDTPLGSNTTKLQVSGRFDDTDITHVLSENLIISGGSGGPVNNGVPGTTGALVARPAGRLQIDPGVVVKLNRARIEVERGAGSLIAEGTIDRPIVFTAQTDKRYGGSGSFDTNSSPTSTPAPGDWGGVFFGEGTSGSIDQAIITFGGGESSVEGVSAPFNALEIHQADVRIANSLIENNNATTETTPNNRNGRGSNGLATIFVRGAQPIIVNNVIQDNLGSAISINANSLIADIQRDRGRSTGAAKRISSLDDNYGPLVRLNRLENNGRVGGGVNGMLVRAEEVVVESVWDDTDIAHVVQGEIIIDNLHSLGGLTLQSGNEESLVVKLSGDINGDGIVDRVAGFTATGTPVEIIDRVGGTIHVLGTVGHPVVLTSLTDDEVGAGFTPSGALNTNANNSVARTTGTPGVWRGLLFDEFSNDRNVAIIRELENPLTNRTSINSIPAVAQNLGVLAPNVTSALEPTPAQKDGDENRRLGFEVHGFISPDDGTDMDVYSFVGTIGTPIWIDIDRTDSALDAVVDIIDANGNVVVGSTGPDSPTGTGAATLTQNPLLGGDYYTQNYRDPGFQYVLAQPGFAVGATATFFVRVRSNPIVPTGSEQSRGKYQLQIRTQQVDEFPGSTVRFSDIRFAATGIDVQGLPAHSPYLGDAGETTANNDTLANAQVLVNLLQTDAAAIGISGELASATDVDWYEFDLVQTGVQVIGGVNDGAGTIGVVFDIDYADGAVSADTTIAVYDQNQNLVYIGRESNVEDDLRPDGQTSINDLTRGSLGVKDGYIGPIHLSPGIQTSPKTYYVAVMSNQQQPSSLNGIFQANVNDATAATRLEPVNSVTRVIEDHIGLIGYDSNGLRINPETAGGLFDIVTPSNQIKPLSLNDLTLYVATDVNGNTNTAGANDSLYTYNPFTGGQYLTRVTNSISSGGSGFDDVQDIVVRSDGRMFGYQRQIPNNPLVAPNFSIPNTVGQLVEIDPATGQVIAGSAQNDNITGPVIGTAGLTVPNTATLPTAIGSHSTRANEFALSDDVDALTFERVRATGSAAAPVPEYDVYYSVRDTDIASRLYRGNTDGNAGPAAAAANSIYGVVGEIQPAGVTFATQTLRVTQVIPGTPPTINITNLRLKARDAGSVGNFDLVFAEQTGNTNASVNAQLVPNASGGTTRQITLTIGRTFDANGAITGAASAAAIVHAINSNSLAKTWVSAVIFGGNANNQGDGNDGTPAFFTTPNITTSVVGQDQAVSTDLGPLKGRVTGLSFADFNTAGNHTGLLYGVTNAGELITINKNTAVVTSVLQSADVFGIADMDFQGLSLGPQNAENGLYKNTLFAVTGDGQVVAFDTVTGLASRVFDNNIVTQTITVDEPTNNEIGYFTITSDAGIGANPRPRFTTEPIAHNAPATLTVNETQSIDTNAYGTVGGLQSRFTLSLVDDQGAITSIAANNINNSNPVAVVPIATAGTTSLIPVESTASFPTAPFVIQIDSEQMQVVAVGGSSFLATRGWNGTTPTAHNDTATVFEIVKSTLNAGLVVPGTAALLSAPINNFAASNVLTVDNTLAFASGQVIRIGKEEMEVLSVDSATQLTVNRGNSGATPITHHNTTAAKPLFNLAAAAVPTAITIVSDTLVVEDALPLVGATNLRIGNEDLRVVSVSTGTNTVQVIRGVNSTTTAAHLANTVVFRLDTTALIDANATPGVIRNALAALPSVNGLANVDVTGGPLSGVSDVVPVNPFATPIPGQIVFQGALKGKDLQPITADRSQLVGDEIQTIRLDTQINRGVFRLDFGAATTIDIPYNANAATVRAALEALPNVGVGNVIVTGTALPAGPLSVQFVNELQDQDVPQLIVDVGTFVPYDVQTISLPNVVQSVTTNSFRLKIQTTTVGGLTISGTSLPLSVNTGSVFNPQLLPTAVQVQAALVGGIAGLTNTNVTVSGTGTTADPYVVQFIGNLRGQNIGPLSVVENNLQPASHNTVVIDTAAIAPNEIQQFQVTGAPVSGSFQLRLVGDPNLTEGTVGAGLGGGVLQTTSQTIQLTDTAATVQNRLQQISGLAGNVLVTSLGPGTTVRTSVMTIEFINELAGLNIVSFVPVNNAFSGGGALQLSTRQLAFSTAQNQVQSVSVPATITSGSFTVTITDPANSITGTSQPIFVGNNAAAITTALNNIPGLTGNILVTGNANSGSNFTIEFTNGLAGRTIAPAMVNFAFTSPTIAETQVASSTPGPRNEIQSVTIPATATGGLFVLAIDDSAGASGIVGTSNAINFGDGAAAIEAALGNIPGLAGQVSVTGSAAANASFTIEFTGTAGNLDLPNFTVPFNILTPFGTVPAIAEDQKGSATGPQDQIQSIAIPNTATSGSFTLSLDDSAGPTGATGTVTINVGDTQAIIQSAIEAIDPALVGNVTVSGDATTGNTFFIQFVGTLTQTELALFALQSDNLLHSGGPSASIFQAASNPLAQNEIQQITLSGTPTAGQFTLSLNDATNSLIGTSLPIDFNDNNIAVQTALFNIPGLFGNIAVGGAALPGGPITIEFVGALAGLDISDFTVTIVNTALAPAAARVNVSVAQNSVPALPFISTTRVGQAVNVPVTQEEDGLLSVFDALDALPNFDPSNFLVNGLLTNPGATVSFIGPYATLNHNDFNINNFLMTNLPPFVVGTPYDGTNNTLATLSNTTSIGDGLADSPIMTISGYIGGQNQGAQRPIGLAFSPFDFNLWHPTTRRATDTGHGINGADDNSRSPGVPNVDFVDAGAAADRRFTQAQGGASLYFGFEPWVQTTNNGSESYITYLPNVNAQHGILTTAFHQDLSSNPNLVTGVGTAGTGSYNLPGGAFGAVETNTFDLSNSVDADRPTLYFNYFLETENSGGANGGSTIGSETNNPFADSARVWIKRNGSTTWELLATNNSQLSVANPNNNNGTAELAGFLSPLADAGLNSSTPRSVSQQQRQELFDNTGQWRQARVDLSDYAGETGLQLRIDFSTAGTLFDPTNAVDPFDGNLRTDTLNNFSGFGEWVHPTRSVRSVANNFEGFYVDDFIIGYAERGEMVTGAGGDSTITNLSASDRTRNQDPNRGALTLAGRYQLEVRRTGEYENYDEGRQLNTVGVTFQTNDRHVIELEEKARVDFESAPPVNAPFDLTQISSIIPPNFFAPGEFPSPWSPTASRPQTGNQSLQSGSLTPIPLSAYQVRTDQLNTDPATNTRAGVIEFSFSTSTSTNDSLLFFIDGVPQNLVATDPDFPNSNNPLFATGELGYRTLRFNLPSGQHTFTWLLRGFNDANSQAFIDNIVLLQGGTGLMADLNREREQGQFIIESNFITDSMNRGINVEPGASQGSGGGVPHPGSLINFPQTNAGRLIPGVVIQNNVVAGSGTGIRFAGATNPSPQIPVPFGRIINNTLVGQDDPNTPGVKLGTGLDIVGISSPTVLNNLFTNLNVGVNNTSTATANGSEAPSIRSNFFQNNTSNGATGSAALFGGTGSPFIDAANRNFYLLPNTSAVDSSQSSEQDRANLSTFKLEIGITNSPIIAPNRDVFGQLRVDSSGATTGGGSSVFIDRGAVDRSDGDAPYAVLLKPVDNLAGADRDPNATVVHLTDPILDSFSILLGDGRGPTSPFEGTGVNGLTVNDATDPTVAAAAVTVEHDGVLLVQGIDYTLGYNPLTGILLLTPLTTLWDATGVYTITLANSQIADLAGNLLRPNQTDGSTKFFVLMPDVRLDFGDAPDSFSTLLTSNGARHTIQTGATPRLGSRVDSELTGGTLANPDDIAPTITVSASSPLFVPTPAASTVDIVVSTSVTPAGGETVQVQIGGEVFTFELVAPGFAAQEGNVAVTLNTVDPVQIASSLANAIRAKLVLDGNASVVSSVGNTITIQTFDDEDGVGVGTYTTDALGMPPNTPFIVFLKDGQPVPPASVDQTDVLGFLNPSDILGTRISINASGTGPLGSPAGKLDAWIDFNGDGSFDPNTEQIFTNQDLVVGPNKLTIVTPLGAVSGNQWARFRISENGNLGPSELAIGGEVEDYQVQIINIAPTVPVPDVFEVDEDGVLDTVNVTSEDSLFDNDSPTGFLPPRFFVETQPINGTLAVADTVNGTLGGRFVYTPAPDFYGQDTFTYWVTTQPEQTGTSPVRPSNVTLATVTINVRPVNDIPLATNKTFTTFEDVTRTITASELIQGSLADADPRFPSATAALAPWNEDQQTFTVTEVTIGSTTVNTTMLDVQGANGRFDIFFNSAGALDHLDFKPNPDFNHDTPLATAAPTIENFSFKISDSGESITDVLTGATTAGTPQTATATASIDVVPRNDTPITSTDFVTIGPIGTTTPVANDWQAYFTSRNQPIPVPTENVSLLIPAGFVLQNDLSGPSTATDENAFTNGNDAALRITSASVSNRDATVSVDSNGDITLVPPTNVYGEIVVTYVVTDMGVDEEFDGTRNIVPRTFTGTITVTLQPVNDRPVSFDRQLIFNESLASGVDSPAHIFTATDLLNGGGSGPQSLPGLFPAGLPSPFNESEQQATLRVSSFSTNAGMVNNNDPSLDSTGTGTLSLTSDSGGRFEFDFVNHAFTEGRFFPLPDYNRRTPFAPVETFLFTVQDDGQTTDPQLVGNVISLPRAESIPSMASFQIVEANDAPVFSLALNSSGQPVFDILERDDLGGTSIANAVINPLPGPSTALDELTPNRQFVSFTILSGPGFPVVPAGLMAAPPTIAANGTLTVFPAVDASGTAVYVFDAIDSEPGTVGFIPRTTRGTLTVNVAPVNDPPTFTPGNDVTVDEDSGSYDEPWATALSGGPADEPQAVTFRVETPLNQQPLFATLPEIDSNGRLTFALLDDVNGIVDLKVTAIDSELAESAPVTLRLNITPLNDPPTAVDPPTIQTDEDSLLSIDASSILINSTDIDSSNGSDQSLRLVLPASFTSALGAEVTFDALTGKVFYNPLTSTALQSLQLNSPALEDSFTFQVADQFGGVSGFATVTLQVSGRNDAAVVRDDVITVSRSGATLLDILGNDVDLDGSIDPASIVITVQPTGGELTFNADRTLTYTPFPEFTGSDFFRYTVGDDLGQQSEQANVTINGSNAPIGGTDNLSVRAGVNDLDVLSNDVLFGDATFDLTTLTIVTPPTGGTAVPQADGTIRYTSNDGFIGSDFFEYVITDSEGRVSEPSRVNLNITALGSQNPSNFMDVDASGEVTAFDALLIINRLNIAGNVRSIPIDPDEPTPPYYDVNGDGFISASDALDVIAEIRRLDNLLLTGGSGEGEFLLTDAIYLSSMSVQVSFNPTPITLPVRSTNPEDEMFALGGDDESSMKIQSSNFDSDTGLGDVIDLIAADSDGGADDGESTDGAFVTVDSLFSDFDNLD